ncbi:tetratricopeptide repeat protein [Limnofasciculus baicalensis]|uniref:Tetratricopeptide repeat protein n=1 Tax=Limnofasciculus baicalensis BBK-W-15 TaxID=2699891 RepID=A0AAE3KQI6_9CYAN|nr:tetratricopeptide repeat protein [Limnofasciculus baicalensis]MCP2731881.1 tetratricopeptide repeat protein [Limnofasciculus baicalensis BBK-W-15]
MLRWILTIFSVVLVCFFNLPAMAEVNLSASEIRQINQLRQEAFTAAEGGNFAAAEGYWSQLIELLPDNPVGWSNRGNYRVIQHKLVDAIADFDKAIELAPDAPDPYLNRGIAYEGEKLWENAIADYQRVLEITPNDAVAYNNLGNAHGGLGNWEDAIANYHKAVELDPNFSFARVNYALALYQIGEKDKAIGEMRNIIRKYPQFADVRAALTAVLWVEGKPGEAESNWVAVVGLDGRYQDLDWVENIRRWPPLMVAALDKFLTLK